MSRYEFDSNGTANPKVDNEDVNSQSSSNSHDYLEEQTSTKGNTVAKDLADFKRKTIESRGYYIARYEASNNNGVVESKANKSVWTDINQPAAATTAQTMYGEEKPFTSDLINSLAWDTALVYMQTFSGDQDYSRQGSLNSSKQNTGISGDVKLNIYDMASNVYEWSTETSPYPGFPCVRRGGNFSIGSIPSSYRAAHSTTGSTSNLSFRPLLYL